MKPEKGKIYYVKAAIGRVGHLSLAKVEVMSVRKVNKKLYSLRCKVLEDFSIAHGFTKYDKPYLRTYLIEHIGLMKPYQFFVGKKYALESVNLWIEAQRKILDKAQSETQMFS